MTKISEITKPKELSIRLLDEMAYYAGRGFISIE